MADLSLLLEFYENLVKSRRFDELLWDAYVNGKPLGMTHLGMGEEAVGTGSMKVFRDTDIVCPHHRAHPHLLMRGCDLKSMLSETLLKATGTCMGKAGEAHFMDVSKNCYVIGGTLGPCFTVPLGFAYNFKHEGKGNIAVAYTGDGCTQEGPFFEARKGIPPSGPVHHPEQPFRDLGRLPQNVRTAAAFAARRRLRYSV